MPKKKEIDSKSLLKMIKEGADQSEIMTKFGFNNATQLKVAYANALMESGEAPEIKGKGRAKKLKAVDLKVTVNSRGSLILPKALIDSMDIKEGEIFEAKKTPSGIMLKAMDESQPEQPTQTDKAEKKGKK